MCPSRKWILPLGKRLTDPNKQVIGFSILDDFTYEDPEHTRAMLKHTDIPFDGYLRG